MEWKFNFRDDGILEVKTNGVFTLDDFREMIEQMISDSRWIPGLNRLLDNRELDVRTLDINAIYNCEKILQAFEDKIGDGRVAILVRDTADYGSGISSQNIMNEKLGLTKFFLSYDKAMEWVKQ